MWTAGEPSFFVLLECDVQFTVTVLWRLVDNGRGKKKAYPVRASVANLSRRSGSRREAQVLVATFPVLSKRADEDRESFKRAKQEVLARCWSIVLAAFAKLAVDGMDVPACGTGRAVRAHVALGVFKADNVELVESLFTRLGYSPRCNHRDIYQGGTSKWFVTAERKRAAKLRRLVLCIVDVVCRPITMSL
jgi:hypothetical protein